MMVKPEKLNKIPRCQPTVNEVNIVGTVKTSTDQDLLVDPMLFLDTETEFSIKMWIKTWLCVQLTRGKVVKCNEF